MGPNNHLFYTGEKKLESIFESIKEQIQKQGPNIQWKINLSPALQENEFDARKPTPPPQQQGMNYPWGNESASEFYDYHLSLEKELSKSQNKLSKYEKKLYKQVSLITKIETEAKFNQNTMKKIHILKIQEDEIRHLNQLKIHELKIKKLKQNVEKLNTVIKILDKIKITSKNVDMSKESLLNDRCILLRKLKVTELRLEIRNVELKALCNTNNNNNINRLSRELISKQSSSRELISKQSSPAELIWKQSSPTELISPRELILKQPSPPELISRQSDLTVSNQLPKKSPLISLGSLADGLLKSSQILDQTASIGIEKNQSIYEPKPTHVYEKRRYIPQEEDKHTKKIKLTYKDQWTSCEDNTLLKRVKSYGITEWRNVSKALPNRSSSECYRRYLELTG